MIYGTGVKNKSISQVDICTINIKAKLREEKNRKRENKQTKRMLFRTKIQFSLAQ